MLPFIQMRRDSLFLEDGAHPVVELTVASPPCSGRGGYCGGPAVAEVLLTGPEVIALARTLYHLYHGTSTLSRGLGPMYASSDSSTDPDGSVEEFLDFPLT